MNSALCVHFSNTQRQGGGTLADSNEISFPGHPLEFMHFASFFFLGFLTFFYLLFLNLPVLCLYVLGRICSKFIFLKLVNKLKNLLISSFINFIFHFSALSFLSSYSTLLPINLSKHLCSYLYLYFNSIYFSFFFFCNFKNKFTCLPTSLVKKQNVHKY